MAWITARLDDMVAFYRITKPLQKEQDLKLYSPCYVWVKVRARGG